VPTIKVKAFSLRVSEGFLILRVSYKRSETPSESKSASATDRVGGLSLFSSESLSDFKEE
jgi:hypothetical protein